MMLEGPAVQAAIGRLPGADLNLAAFGLTLSLALLIESPAIMLLATAIALVTDGHAYVALRRFVIRLGLVATALTAVLAFTPLFDWVGLVLMKQPAAIVAGARPAIRILLLWTAAIAWRRFYQGVLVRHRETYKVSWGTAIRLTTTVSVAVILTILRKLPGAEVAATAIMAAVLAEALASTVFAMPVVRQEVLVATRADGPRLSQKRILKFHAPLAATTLLNLLAQPMTTAALGRLRHSTETLAAWPVVFMLLLVIRGWGMALQEITVAQADDPAARLPLRRFTLIVGAASSAATALIAFTPLLNVYLGMAIHLPPSLWPQVRLAIAVCALLPLITALASWARGRLVAAGLTVTVYRGMGVNLAVEGVVLVAGVLLRLPGMWVASAAFTLSALAEYAYLRTRTP